MSGFTTEQLLYPLTKGDKEGHAFHGNQYKQGESGQSQDPHIQAFSRNLKEFYDAGGTVQRIENQDEMLNVLHEAQELRQTPEYQSMDTRHQQGIRFLEQAAMYAHVDFRASQSEVNPHEVSKSYLLVARDAQGNLVSAINASIRDGYHLDENEKRISNDAPATKAVYIGYLGSTGKMAGAATSLMEQAIQIASDNKIPVVYETTADSSPYHEMLGAENFGRSLSGFTTAQAQEIAKLPNPEPKIIKFTTQALLYPLTKGDKDGHAFHGNQWKTVATDGSVNTTRPPVGRYQLTAEETKAVAKFMSDAVNNRDEFTQQVTAMVSKMLGKDAPATKLDAPLSTPPDFYRGCDPQGAEALVKPLDTYQKNGGSVWGVGIYATPNQDMAQQYINGLQGSVVKDGVVVQAWLDPSASVTDSVPTNINTRQLPYGEAEQTDRKPRFPETPEEATSSLTPDEKTLFDYWLGFPANSALVNGYDAFRSPEGTMVVLDRSKMKVYF